MGKNYLLDVPFKSGGEGEIYKLNQQFVAKIYYDTIINPDRQQKVLALCTSYSDKIDQFGTDSYAFPQKPAFKNEEPDYLCGFSMSFFDYPTLGDIGYDLSTKDFRTSKSAKLNDDKAVKFIYDTFDAVDRLHKSRIILGDVNPGNIMYNPLSNYPVIIDLDAAQVGPFRCLAWSPEYLDPLIEQQGKNIHGGYNYSFESDIFSLACICFEFVIGVNPFFVHTDPPPQDRIVHNKEHGISSIRFFHTGSSILNGFRYISNPVNSNIKARIEVIKSKYPKLYDFFISIFLDSHRISLMQTLDRSDIKHPAYIFYSQSDFGNVLKQIITERKKLEVVRQASPVASQVGGFIPDSGFSRVLQSATIRPANTDQKVVNKKSYDPRELVSFLSNYGMDISDIFGAN